MPKLGAQPGGKLRGAQDRAAGQAAPGFDADGDGRAGLVAEPDVGGPVTPRTELSVAAQRQCEFRIMRRVEQDGVVGFGIRQGRVRVVQLWIEATLRADTEPRLSAGYDPTRASADRLKKKNAHIALGNV